MTVHYRNKFGILEDDGTFVPFREEDQERMMTTVKHKYALRDSTEATFRDWRPTYGQSYEIKGGKELEHYYRPYITWVPCMKEVVENNPNYPSKTVYCYLPEKEDVKPEAEEGQEDDKERFFTIVDDPRQNTDEIRWERLTKEFIITRKPK